MKMVEEQWPWSTSLSMDTSGIHLQTQKILQNISCEQAGVPDHWKRKYRTIQNSVGEMKEGRKEESEQDWICTWGLGD